MTYPSKTKYLKILTANIPVRILEDLAKLVGDGGIYPSRSEAIRVAIRDFLHKLKTKIAEYEARYRERAPHEFVFPVDMRSLAWRRVLERLDK